MASRSRTPEREVEPIPRRPDQLVGRRLIERLDDHLRHLHRQPAHGSSHQAGRDNGQRPTHGNSHQAGRDNDQRAVHGNRTFFYDQLVVAHLLAFFNPAMHSLRRIDDVFDLPAVRRRFGFRAAARSTVADAQRLFDPELLRPILDDLTQRANLQPHDARLDDLTRQLTAVDGTFFAVAPRIAWALYNRKSDDGVRRHTGRRGRTTRGNIRAHVHFDILRGVPERFSLTGGQASEGGQLRVSLRPEHCYVLDRGFQSYDLLGDILQAHSDFVVRLRKSARRTELEPRPLTAADLAAGVVADALVQIGWRDDQTPPLPTLRRVEVAVDGHDGPLVLLTSCLDLPAETIALIYQHRWQIELFFRWLKCMAHLEHFYSESPQGMTLQLYVTIIGTLLIALETGARPSVYDFSLLSFALSGQAPLEEVLAVAAKRRAERARDAETQRRRNARKAAEKKSA
jgi:Transposase DDE domain